MKKTTVELVSTFEEEIKKMFNTFIKLPKYAGSNYAYIVEPKGENTFQKLKDTLFSISQ